MIGEFIELSNGIEMGSSISLGNNTSIGIRGNVTPYKATIVARNNEVCNIDGHIGNNNYETVVKFNDCSYTVKSFGQSNTFDSLKNAFGVIKDIAQNSLKSAVSNLLPQIYDQNNNMIGSCEILFDGSGLGKYSYIKYNINNVVLYAYELSHDASDILYCIYNSNNQMVATVSKKTKIVHGHARYTIYCCSDEWFRYIALITVCWSIQYTSNDGSAGTFNIQKQITTQKGLLEKYNPTFIEQVKQKEGWNNIPENMSLVQEKVLESKKSSEVIIHKTLFLIGFIVIFVIIFIMILISFVM